MTHILLYSHDPFYRGLVGALGALITYLLYLGICYLIALFRGGKSNSNNKELGVIENEKNNTNLKREVKESNLEIEDRESMEIKREVGVDVLFCKFCGVQIDTNSIFCPHCGKRINGELQKSLRIGNIVSKGRAMMCHIWDSMRHILQSLKRKIGNGKAGKWGKRILKIFVAIIIALCLYGVAGWIYYDLYIPHHYDSLYNDGMKDVKNADAIALELFDARYYDQSIEVLTNSAEKGNVQSMLLLGRYYKGYNIKMGFQSKWHSKYQSAKSLDKSSYWYLQAARNGNAEAQGELGHNYKYGFGVKQDFDKAVYWLKQGADNGDAVAQWRLGNVYENGLAYYWGNFSDYQIWWYNGNGFRAKDNPNASLDVDYVANMKKKEPMQVFIVPDIEKAKHYWKLAANHGLKEAKESLEKIYEGDD